ncbi:MAG: hypothetical protein OXF02_00895 [Simkaniaceae bacterium]|nr:hypothetical protein [Simkaniaceae bacterium]
MAGEFERIMEFFTLSPEKKEEKLQEVFEDSVEYFERFKHVMANGTPEEKKQAIDHVMLMKKRIEEETKQICAKTGMTEEQLAQFSNDPNNFSPDQWETIRSAKEKLESGVDELKKTVRDAGVVPLHGPREVKRERPAKEKAEGDVKKKKRRKQPKNWLPS